MPHHHYEVVCNKNWRGRTIHQTMEEATDYARQKIASGRYSVCAIYISKPGAFERVATFTA